MERINKGSDLTFSLGETSGNIEDVIIYTRNKDNYIKKTSCDIDRCGFVRVTWEELSKLEEGVLHVTYHTTQPDESYSDKKRDIFKEKTLQYYIMTGLTDEVLKAPQIAWGNIIGSIHEQKDLFNVFATIEALGKKQNAEQGKSLVADTEISRLSTLHNYDDTSLKGEITETNRQLTTTQKELTEVKQKAINTNSELSKAEKRISNIETDMSILAEILQRMESKMDDNFLTEGEEIVREGKFTHNGDDFFLTIACNFNKETTTEVKSRNNVLLKAQLSESNKETFYPFQISCTSPILLKSVTITAQDLKDYRFFWGLVGDRKK